MSDELFVFEDATKEEAKGRLALIGPSGSGKTWTMLTIARTLAGPEGRIAVVDTEHGSASKYAAKPGRPESNGKWRFQRLNLSSYSPQTLIKAVHSAAAAGFDVLCIDSMSHFWRGKDGMLEQVDKATTRAKSKNSFSTGWKEMSPIEHDMLEALLHFPGHVIVTMRVKTEYVIAQVNGKSVPQKVGLQPVQRDGLEYEFDLVADMNQENQLVVSKSRCPELSDAVVTKPGKEFAETFLGWLTDGEQLPTVQDYYERACDPQTSTDDLRGLYLEVKQRGMLPAPTPDGATLGNLIAKRGQDATAAQRRLAAVDDPLPHSIPVRNEATPDAEAVSA